MKMTQNGLPRPSTADRLQRIVEQARAHDGQPPFSDLSLVELRTGVRSLVLVDDLAAAIVAETEAEFVVVPDARGQGTGTALLERLIAASPTALRFWAHGDHPAARALAASHGLVAERRLLQLRAAVPEAAVPEAAVPDTVTAAVVPAPAISAFRPGRDDAEWLRVNAVAFAAHPEQGAVSQADLDELTREPWFVSEDFLLLRDGGSIVGFCWLKLENGVGEFYVLGVTPARQAEGFGRRLVAAGFARLAERGIRIASLYVEADNAAALKLYHSFGFEQHSVDIQYANQPPR
jgi:mycothiol synthase